MVADANPVSLLLHLPLDECPESLSTPLLDLGSGYNVAVQSAIALHVGLCPDHRGWSVAPFTNLLDLGIRFTHVRELHISNIVVQPTPSEDAPLQQPRFACLESLVIANWSAYLPIEGAFSWFILHLIQHMPRLKNLTVYAPMTRQFGEPTGTPLQYPELPFSLTKFICAAAIPASVCAHIVLRSWNTLKALKVNLLDYEDDDDAPLIEALARAAPRLRELDMRLRLPGDSAAWPRVQSFFAALVRVESLSLEVPLRLQDTLDLLSGLGSIHALSLWSSLNVQEIGKTSAAASRFATHILRYPCLRSVRVCDFNVGDDERSELLELCRSRRIDCHIAN